MFSLIQFLDDGVHYVCKTNSVTLKKGEFYARYSNASYRCKIITRSGKYVFCLNCLSKRN